MAPGVRSHQNDRECCRFSESTEEYSKRFKERLNAGLEDSMDDATKKLMFLLSGKVDALTGRHISISDSEDELIENIDTILSDNLYTLGLIK